MTMVDPRLRPHRRQYRVVLALAIVLGGAAEARAQGPPLPTALAARFTEGVAALQAGSLEAAEAAFRGVLRDGGSRAFVHHNLGIVLQRRGRHAAAITSFRQAAALDPTYGPPRLLAGASELALGRPVAAIRELEAAVRLMPKEIAARLQLADACERAGRVECLTDAYRAVVGLAPDETEYAYRLGKAYLRRSQQAYERIRAVDPASARLQQALAGEYVAQGQPLLARQAYEAAAARDPRLPGIHVALARLHADDGRWDDAEREVALELALVPASRDARELKARIEAARRAAGR